MTKKTCVRALRGFAASLALSVGLAHAAPAPLIVTPSFPVPGKFSPQFAVPLAVTYSSRTNGEWANEGSVATWTLVVKATGAKSMSFAASNVVMPADTALTITGSDGVAHKMSAQWVIKGRLWSDIVPGDTMTVIAKMPSSVSSAFSMDIVEVQAGFRSRMVVPSKSSQVPYAGSSGSARTAAPGTVVNAACVYPNGEPSTAYIITNNTAACTATLVNDAAQDFKPYLLTAAHCATGNISPTLAQMQSGAQAMRAEFLQVTQPCSATPAAVDSPTIVGATHIAQAQDTWLVKLNNAPPSTAYYAGFNTANNIPASGTGVHHANNLRQQYVAFGQFFSQTGSLGTFWAAHTYVDGSTDHGASGSSLFVNNQTVGTLFGSYGTDTNGNPVGGSYSPLAYAASAITPYLGASANGAYKPVSIPTVSLSANPAAVSQYSGTSTITWSSVGADSCTASGAWSGSQATSGSQLVGPWNTTGTLTYTLACTNSAGTTSKSATVTVNALASPDATISASPATVVASTGTSTITWSATNATSCTASASPADSGWTGSVSATGGSKTVGPWASTGAHNFFLTCSNPAGSAGGATTVTVNAPSAPVVSMTQASANITTGQTTTISWTSTNSPTACTASASPADSNFTGSQGASGTVTVGPYSSAKTVTYTMTCSNAGGSSQASKTVTVTQAPAPVVSLTSSASTATQGVGNSTLTWSASNATSCTASANPVDGVWSGNVSTSGGTQAVGPWAASGAHQYTLSCTGNGGTTTQSQTITVNAQPVPVVTINASATALSLGQSSTLTWSATNNPLSCTASASPSSGAWTGSKPASGNLSVGPFNTAGTYTYTLSCSNAGGSGSSSVAIGVNAPAPTLSFSSSSAQVTTAGTFTLTWSGTNLSSCTAVSSPVDAQWNGSKTTSGSQVDGPLTAGTYTYTLNCVSTGSTPISKNLSVVVTPPSTPSVSLSLASTTIPTGQGTTISWSSTNASGCTASSTPSDAAFTGGQGTSGSMAVGPYNTAQTITYTMTCGGVSRSATLNVSAQSPVANIAANRTVIQTGQTVAITWNPQNATSCTASANPADSLWTGAKSAAGGAATVGPYAAAGTITYSLTCTSSAGSNTKSVSVQVQSAAPTTPAPTVTIGLSRAAINTNESTTLSWSTTNADNCAASGAWSGSEPSVGSITITPTTPGNQIFTLSCTGAGGSGSNSVTLTVNGTSTGANAFPMSSDKNSIQAGESFTLTWNASSSGFGNCVASTSTAGAGNWAGNRSASASQSITPTATGTQTYVLTCADSHGVAKMSTTSVTVNASAPSAGGGGGSMGFMPMVGLMLMAFLRRRRSDG